MKFSKKLTLISVATLMTVAPIVPLAQNQTIAIQAATKSTVTTVDTIVSMYNAKGNYVKSVKANTIFKNYGIVTIHKRQYYKVGNNKYIKATAIGRINGKDYIRLDYNSAVYNSNGKRAKTSTIKKNSLIRFYSTKTIKGTKYYRIGKNKYIKAANVGVVNGKTIYAKETYVTVTEQTASYTKDGYANDVTYKKGQKVEVDQYISIPASYIDNFTASNDDSPVYFYRIKGQEDSYIPGNRVKPRKQMKLLNYDDMHYSYIKITEQGDLPVYGIDGNPSNVVIPHAATNAASSSLSVDRLMYIWVPTEKKAELFYHISSAYIDVPAGDVYSIAEVRKYIGNGFIPAKDAKESGVKLTPANTPEEAEKDIAIAQAADKSGLKVEIDKKTSIEASDKYKLTSRDKRDAYDEALKDAQAIYNSPNSTIAQVKIALFRLKQRSNDLDGKKVHVKNINKLTESEALKVYRVAYNANDVYSPKYQYLISISFKDHNSKLVMNLKHYSKSIQDPKYLLSDTTKDLKISDYATEN